MRRHSHFRPVSAGLLALALVACTAPVTTRRAAYYNVDTPVPYTVQAGGYASEDGDAAANRHYSVSVNLRTAQPFIFIFPDGRRVNSREITAGELNAHLAATQAGASGRLSSTRSRSIAQWDKDVIHFDIGQDGFASHLWLYACRRQLPGILATADGARVFDFPIREGDLRTLVGPPTRSGTAGAGIGVDCDAP